MAHCDEFILAVCLRATTTVVGERGVKHSGGQRQRRSPLPGRFWRSPRVLILDEATSSLDSESGQMIQDGLRKALRSKAGRRSSSPTGCHDPAAPIRFSSSGRSRSSSRAHPTESAG